MLFCKYDSILKQIKVSFYGVFKELIHFWKVEWRSEVKEKRKL